MQSNFLSGTLPAAATTDTPEITILMDWSALAGSLTGGYTRSTGDIAAAVAEQLVIDDFLPGLSQPVATLPFHLLGHSRGAGLVGELARELGERGIWVDHVTTLDPHPIDGIREPWLLNLDFGDAPMTAWSNVAFWDNYWRSEGDNALFDVTGEPIPQTHNVHLNENLLADGGYGLEHLDTHLWYYGTINTSEDPPAFNGDVEVPNHWYGGVHPTRDATGYAYSRVIGYERANEGLSSALGGSANRISVNQATANWPNVLHLELNAPGSTLEVGDSFSVDFLYQDVDSSADVFFSLDTDRNPFNADLTRLSQTTVAASTSFASGTSNPAISTTGLAPGEYYVLATIDDGSQQRHSYLERPITLTTEDNIAPIAINDTETTDEEQNVSIDVLLNDRDDDHDLLSIASVVSPTTNQGAVVIESDGTLTYTPAANFFGSDSFTYQATDGTSDSNIATVTITVNAVNDAPVATGESYDVTSGVPFDLLAPGILSNDTDVDGDSLTAVLDSNVHHGSLTLNADGSFRYAPNQDFIGSDSFSYHARDRTLDSNVVTVTFNVTSNEVVLFADSFEVSEWNGRWVEDTQNDWFRSTQRATDGRFAAEVDGRTRNATLTMAQSVDLSNMATAVLTFDWLIERQLDTGDYLALDISEDDGSTWTEVSRLNGNSSPENQWLSESIDLSANGHVTSHLKIRFRGMANRSNEDANVDNVRIVATVAGPPNQAPADGVDLLAAAFAAPAQKTVATKAFKLQSTSPPSTASPVQNLLRSPAAHDALFTTMESSEKEIAISTLSEDFRIAPWIDPLLADVIMLDLLESDRLIQIDTAKRK